MNKFTIVTPFFSQFLEEGLALSEYREFIEYINDNKFDYLVFQEDFTGEELEQVFKDVYLKHKSILFVNPCYYKDILSFVEENKPNKILDLFCNNEGNIIGFHYPSADLTMTDASVESLSSLALKIIGVDTETLYDNMGES